MPGARPSEDAAASAIAFAVSGVVFLAALATLVYVANDKVPPAHEDAAFVDYTHEARGLIGSFVRTTGTAWVPAKDGGYEWDDVNKSLVPGLATAGGAIDVARVDSLAASATENVTVDGRFQYSELRDVLGLAAAHRDMRIVIVYDTTGETLLTYGPDVSGVSAEPATAYVPLSDGHLALVSLQVFPSSR